MGGRNYCFGQIGLVGTLRCQRRVVRLAGVGAEDKSWGVSMGVSEAMGRCDFPVEQVRKEEAHGTSAPEVW